MIELSPSEMRDLFNDIGEMRQQLIHVEKTLDSLIEEVARKRNIDWKGLLTASAALLAVMITILGGIGTLEVEHIVSVEIATNNQTIDEKMKLLREQVDEHAQYLVNKLRDNTNETIQKRGQR
jgi:hypothetical protein